jgi:hypothetical protein
LTAVCGSPQTAVAAGVEPRSGAPTPVEPRENPELDAHNLRLRIFRDRFYNFLYSPIGELNQQPALFHWRQA